MLLLPNRTDFHRKEISLKTILHPNLSLHLPVISAPMDTVTGEKLMLTMSETGGLGVLHRNMLIDDQIEIIKKVKQTKVISEIATTLNGQHFVAVAVGVKDTFESDIAKLVEAGTNAIFFDTAHAHSGYIIEAVKVAKKNHPDLIIVAGNIATYEAAKDLHEAGADILKVGMGPGAICTTRVVTGVGVPQLTAISEVARYAKENNITLIGDGGIKQIGDMAKAIAFGADAVMIGSLMSGFDQSLGEILEHQGKKYKSYRGMGSSDAMNAGSANRYGQDGKKAKAMVAEGVSGLVAYKGDANEFIEQIRGGLISSFNYLGAKSITDFYDNSKLSVITGSAIKESHPHSILINSNESSYL